MSTIDLRSDTVTLPTPSMKRVMEEALLGDDVFAEDPSANSFQEKMAKMFGFDAGLFVPSGTMSNQLALKAITDPGDEVLIESKGHIIQYEAGGASVLSGVQLFPIIGSNGKLNARSIPDYVRGAHDWEPRTRVVCLEHSTNKGGGAVYTWDELLEIRSVCNDCNLLLHIDGARIWNAMMATGQKPSDFGALADTLSICFSKGLGAPIGSMLLSDERTIAKARRFRKMWGGGMRQIGMLTAAADYAVEHHWPKMKQDHINAKLFAGEINKIPDFSVDLDAVQTNIVIFNTGKREASEVITLFADQGIRMVPFGKYLVRATFHFQITTEQVTTLITTMYQLFSE
ncbi:MAG: aminotransferase class V-fold PLP-dependent enzyme [Bacteroidetes bacterium]|nr:aminotransferase class V-fold PLP-dependent enzyme [Bacteroidota bacterium]